MILILAGIVLFVSVVALVWFILTFNRFQVLKNGAVTGLGQIAVALKKRFDLISQLVDAVKAYAAFERGVFEKVTELRSILQRPETTKSLSQANQDSRSLLDRIALTIESYPDLKASENVTRLMTAITDVEDEIARLRYTYNNIVQDYNTRRDTFPSRIVARLSHFTALEYLQFEETSKAKPETRWNP